MANEIERENFDVRGPRATTLFCIAVGASSSAVDLSTAGYEGLLSAINAGRMVTMKASGGNIWYRWGTATGTMDETKTAVDTPANQGQVLFANERSDERPPLGCTWLILKGSVACTLRIHVSSASQSVYVGA